MDKDLKELERIKYLTTGEVEKVFKVIKKSGNVRDLALFSVLYYYGLRSAEAGQLRLQDVNLEDLTIKIWRVKNGISREYPLTPDLKRNIKKYLEIRTDKESPLFVSRKKTKTGGKLSRGRIHTIWKEYAKKAKIDEGKRNVHALRHAIGVHLADAGQSVEFVRQHLGHRRIQNTLVYFQISTARTREIYQELDGKLAKI